VNVLFFFARPDGELMLIVFTTYRADRRNQAKQSAFIGQAFAHFEGQEQHDEPEEFEGGEGCL
jgi:hypothetical protein